MNIPTSKDILQRMLDRTPNNLDKRQGSIIYDALAPAAIELAQMYADLASTFDLVFIDTASGDYLDKLVEQNGVTRKDATKAIRKGIFSKEITIGSRFSIEDTTYVTLSKIEGFEYRLECEQEGSIGNKNYGTLTPLSFIQGLSTAEIADIIDAGVDKESDDDLKKRYVESVTAPQFGGNISDYKVKTKSLEGVGGVKVIPIWDGPGTVKLIITDSVYNTPTNSLIDYVQEEIDPTQSQEGLGIAPIGHKVTVVGTVDSNITVSTTLTLEPGKIVSDVQSAINEVVDNYFLSLKTTWDDIDYIVVRIAQIETRMLGVPGVLDVTNTKINGGTSNIDLDSSELPKRNGNVVITV